MTEITWTEEEYAAFEDLVDAASSPNQLDRISSRLDMPKFIQEHGREKCDAMFAHMTKDEKK